MGTRMPRHSGVCFARKTKGGEESVHISQILSKQKCRNYMADIMKWNPDNSPVTIPCLRCLPYGLNKRVYRFIPIHFLYLLQISKTSVIMIRKNSIYALWAFFYSLVRVLLHQSEVGTYHMTTGDGVATTQFGISDSKRFCI